jgi:hypothetical protein
MNSFFILKKKSVKTKDDPKTATILHDTTITKKHKIKNN